jgi:NAD-dependent dihydropyrimidine dehydrogenase PreA subunit
MVYYIAGAVVALWLAHGIHSHIRGRGKTIRVVEENCTGCRKCLKTCHHNVLEAVKDEKGTHITVKNPDKCTACGNCLSACKFNTLELVRINPLR